MSNGNSGSLAAGIVLMMCAGFLFATLDSLAKQLTYVLPVVQIVWARYVVQTTLMTGYVTYSSGTRFLHTRRPVLQVLRGLALLSASLCMYLSLPHIPIADATALVFFSPMVVTLLSVVFLKEKIGLHRILAIGVGLAGVMLIIEPGFGSTGPYHLLPLAAAVINAIYLMLTRQLAGAEESAATQFHTTAVGTVVLSFFVYSVWVPPSATTVALLVALGAMAAAGHFCVVRAFSHAPASLLSPYLYCQVIFAALYSMFWFGDQPRPMMVAGAALLMASGLYIWWRERLRAVE